jgi:GAF domain
VREGMREQSSGIVSWVRELPGKVADEIVVKGLAVLVIAAIALVVSFFVDTRVQVWVAALALVVGLVIGGVISTRGRADTDSTEQELDDLRRRASELRPYDIYVEHVRDALDDLRKVIRGELPAFSLGQFIEAGIFEPAHRFLTTDGERGEVRFSILHPDAGDENFVMASADDDPFPAFGHRMESRQRFKLAIPDSFSQFAYRRNRVCWSGDLSGDDRFEPHKLAVAERGYESIVSVPLRGVGGNVDGVLNVVATNRDAFSAVDRTYISLLGSVVDVARATRAGET